MKKRNLIMGISLVLSVVILCIMSFVFSTKSKDQERTLAYKIYNDSKKYVKDNSSSNLFDGNTNILPYLSKDDKMLNGSSVIVDENGNIALKLFYDNNCFYKDFNDEDIIQTKDKNECSTYTLNYRGSTSMYSWHSYSLSKSSDLLKILKNLRVRDLYQSISSDNMDKKYLEEIVKNYHDEGINIYRLIGDAEWSYDIVEPQKKIEEIIDYNKTVTDDAKILGVTIDIEPHTSRKWDEATDESKQELFNTYVDNMIKLYDFAKKGDLEVVLCTSVWFDSYKNYERLYTSAADTFSIMNYEKEHNVENIEEELELIEKNDKKVETVAHSSINSDEIESYHNDSFDKLQEDQKKILDNYDYEKFRASYHYLPTINYLKSKQDFVLVYCETDDDSVLKDMTFQDSKGNKISGTLVSLKDNQYYLFVGINPGEEYEVSSSSHDVVSNDSIIIEKDENGIAKINIKFEKKRSDPKIGDYVAYPYSYTNVIDGWKSESSLSGWRILAMDGDFVKIVSAGTPELYEYSSDADTAIEEIEEKLKKYLNSYYGTSVESLNKEMIDDYCDCDSANIGNIEDTIINNNSNVLLATKHDDKRIYLLENTGDIYRIGNIKAKFGIRPVITLKIDQFEDINEDNEWIISSKW